MEDHSGEDELSAWRDAAPPREEICHLARFAHLAYWWEGPEHQTLENLRGLAGRLRLPHGKDAVGRETDERGKVMLESDEDEGWEAEDIGGEREQGGSKREPEVEARDSDFEALAPRMKRSIIKPFKDAYDVCACLQSAFDDKMLS
eukprot:3644164-Rhodomonas_salina.1